MKKLLILAIMMLLVVAGGVYAASGCTSGDITPTLSYMNTNPSNNAEDNDGTVNFWVDASSNMTGSVNITFEDSVLAMTVTDDPASGTTSGNRTYTASRTFTSEGSYPYNIVIAWTNQTTPCEGNLTVGTNDKYSTSTATRHIRINFDIGDIETNLLLFNSNVESSDETQATIDVLGTPVKTTTILIILGLGAFFWLRKKK